jgi:pimeloyl-ACP methyl ester carboxylesterase
LTVPLDYENPEAGTADIAFIRYFISEDVEDLLFNPGGPGQSGVKFATTGASDFASKWNMNIVSFDPRGVFLSGPNVDCSYESSNSTTLRRRQDSSVNGLRATWEDTLKTNQACSAANENTDAKYVGTAAVVQDMMHFVELQAALRGQDPKTALINYYGVSYGTAVGQTLVNLYPDRLRRVLLDGNVYSVAHYQGWEPSGIDDFAYGVFMFSKLCFEAGTEWCALAEGMSSIEEVHERFDAAITKLNGNPVQIEGTTYDGNTFVSAVGGWLYFPTQATADGGGYLDIVNATLAVENDQLEAYLSGSAVQKRSEQDPNDNSQIMLGIITAVDIAGRFPWKTYDEWKAATMRLVATAPYNAIGYAGSNG